MSKLEKILFKAKKEVMEIAEVEEEALDRFIEIILESYGS